MDAGEGDFVVAIPARYGSSRLPGKPLREIAGRPLIEHVHDRARESGAAEIIVATDDERVRTAAEGFGARVVLTSRDHPSGTDRLAEVARLLQWAPERIVVNLQGDEPLVAPGLIRSLADALARHADAAIATLATPIHTTAELFDPHAVKVVTDAAGYALYFSRAPIPWDRSAFATTTERLPEDSQHFRHIGLYAYRAGFLEQYNRSAPCYLERTESLEQLRALWYGARIHVSVIERPPGHGVDTEEDLARVAALLQG